MPAHPAPESAGLWSPQPPIAHDRAGPDGHARRVGGARRRDDHADRRRGPGRRRPGPVRLGLLRLLPRQPARDRRRRRDDRPRVADPAVPARARPVLASACSSAGSRRRCRSSSSDACSRASARARSRRSPTSRSGGRCRSGCGPRCSRRCRRRGSCPACSGRSSPAVVAEAFHWRLVFLGLLPLIAIAAVMAGARDRGDPGSSTAERRARRRGRHPAAPAARAHPDDRRGADDRRPDRRRACGRACRSSSSGSRSRCPRSARLTPPGTLRAARGLPAAVLLRGILTFAFFCADAYVALALEDWRGTSAIEAGIALTAATLSLDLGRVDPGPADRADRAAAARPDWASSWSASGSSRSAAVLSPSGPDLIGIATWAVAGLGMGFSYSPLSLTVLRAGVARDPGRVDRRAPAVGRARDGARDRRRRGADRDRPPRGRGGLGRPGGDVRGRRRRRRDRVRRCRDDCRAAVTPRRRPTRCRSKRLETRRRAGVRGVTGQPRRRDALDWALDRAACSPAVRFGARGRSSGRVPRPMSAEELRARIREIPDFPKPGILFYDITTLLKDPAAYKEAIDLMIEPYQGESIDVVVGMESRGFIFSSPMAYQLGAGLVPVRKLGKLPAETITVEYALEYGSNTLEIHRDAIQAGQKVLIVDDLLATGGTVKGTIELVERLKGEVVGPGVPRRAGLPQGPRPPRRPARHERHQVLNGEPPRDAIDRAHAMAEPTASDAAEPGTRRRSRPRRPTAGRRPGARRRRGSRSAAVLPPVRGRDRDDRGDRRRGGPGAPADVGRARRRASSTRSGSTTTPRPRGRRRDRRRRPTPGRSSGRRSGWSGATIRFVDQRSLPRAVVEHAASTAAEVDLGDPERDRCSAGRPPARRRRSAWP